jgi:NADH-quinone oxidoreductase subunit M
MLMGASALLLVGILGIYFNSAPDGGPLTFNFVEISKVEIPYAAQMFFFPLTFVGFGVLGAMYPFHTWSPDGHAAAPAAGSMLHAGVLMKLGAYGVLRLGFQMLPEAAADLAWLVGTVAVINILWGAMAACWQTDIKYLIAYSSVSHMGIVMLGMATLNYAGMSGSVFQMVAHGIMTALLFTLVNLIYHKTHNRDMTTMGGLAHRMPGMAAFFVIAGLSSLGLPGLAGFAAEFLVFIGAWSSAHPWWLFPGVLGALFTAIYVLRAVKIIFFGQHKSEFDDVQDAQGVEWVTLIVLAGMLILLGLFPRLILDSIHLGVGELLAGFGV